MSEGLRFQRVAETKSRKNRVHLDVRVEDCRGLLDQLFELGGREIRTAPRFTVVADSEGNELCLTE